jgi:hypothetical protein
MKLSNYNDPVWDCIYHYFVRPKIPTRNAVDSPNGYIEGFEILLNNTSVPSAEKEKDKLSECLENILTIKSGITIDAMLTSFERKDKITGNSELEGAQRHVWNDEGGIDTLNLGAPSIQNILNSGTSPNLEDLSSSVSHLSQGHYGESINRAFSIVEKNTSIKDFWKFNCIRNVVTHRKLDKSVKDSFVYHFGPNVYDAFDFKKYDPKNGIINLDFKSKKTRKTLFDVAIDLINECKRILGL